MHPRILVPHDFSPTAEAALAWAVGLARSLDGRVTLLHVLALPTSGLVPENMLPPDFPSTADVDNARAALRATAASHGVPDAELEVLVAAGPVGELIVSAAEAHRADLIAMGTHGRGPLTRAVLGSVADHVVRHATCAVVTLRAAAVAQMAERERKQRESGAPGGGKGRTDEVSRHGIFPYSVQPHPQSAEPELRTPASLTPHNSYEESGRSEPFMYEGQLVVGESEAEKPAAAPPPPPAPPARR